LDIIRVNPVCGSPSTLELTLARIPDFKTLDEAVEFWETHDSADYWADVEEVTFEVDRHRNLLHPRMAVVDMSKSVQSVGEERGDGREFHQS